MLFPRIRLFLSLALIGALGACAADGRDSGGTPMTVEEQDSTIEDSTLWLPGPIIADSAGFTRSLRDNQYPLEEVVGTITNFYDFQYLPGFYVFFAKSSTRKIQDEAIFRNFFSGRIYAFEGEPEKIGFQTSLPGGYVWRSEWGSRHCIAARIGTAFGARTGVGRASGTPYNAIVALFHCADTAAEIDAVEDFIRDPELVEDREAFIAHVRANQSAGEG